MPELPEVETVKNVLKQNILNEKIVNYNLYYDKLLETKNFEKIINQCINDVKRRGKWLMIELDDYYLLSHLRMEGKYLIRNINDPYSKHELIGFDFKSGKSLRYKDTRKFGRMYLIDKNNVYNVKPLNELGLEPFDETLNVSYLKDKYKNKKLPIKTVLLDQTIIVGIGNIYADEILFLSKINPYKKAYLLNDDELNKIINNTKYVLLEAIKKGGTTIKSYESSEGVHGGFQSELKIHGQKICKSCGKEVIKDRINGRGTYYCINCQKEN